MKETYQSIMASLERLTLKEQNAVIEQVVIQVGKNRDEIIGKAQEEASVNIDANRELAEMLRPKQGS